MRKLFLTLAVSAVLALPATAATRRNNDDDFGSAFRKIIATLRGAVVRVLDEVGVPKP